MARSVLICSTAWKSSLSPDEANALIAGVLHEARPDWEITCLPLADGGDGWLDCLLSAPKMVLETHTLVVTGPVSQQTVVARYLRDAQNQRLFLESAEIHGMRRLVDGIPQPLTATSYGVGEALLALLESHPETRELVLSVGGSASTDGGLGFLQALGWRFQTSSGDTLNNPIGAGQLSEVTQCEAPQPILSFPKITLLTDVETQYVDSPRLFGPQKGVAPDMVGSLTKEFQRVAKLVDSTGERQGIPGSGAAGGLPFGVLMAFPEAEMTSGIAWTGNLLGFHKALQAADVVITGEGRFDETSLLGKVTGYVMGAAQAEKKPLLVLCGQSSFEKNQYPGAMVQGLYPQDEVVTPAQFAQTPERIRASLWAALSAIE